MNEISKSLHDSIISTSLSKLNIDSIEKFLNGVVDDMDDIPIIGTIAKLGKWMINGSNYLFMRKACVFLFEIKDISAKERYEFIGEIEVREKDNAGDVFMSLLDRLDNINKVTIVANLFKARVMKDISTDDFIRLTSVLERIPLVDLSNLELYNKPYYKAGSTEVLNASGAIRLHTIDAGDAEGNGEDKYILTELGAKILRYGLLSADISDIQQSNIQVPTLGWNYI